MSATSSVRPGSEKGMTTMKAGHRVRRRAANLCVSLATALAALACAVPASAADFVTSFDGMLAGPDGRVAEQAGSHPVEAWADIRFAATTFGAQQWPIAVENSKNLIVSLPPGLVGAPNAIPRCTLEQLAAGGHTGSCPVSTQVGVIGLNGLGATAYPFDPSRWHGAQWVPLHNMEPPRGAAAAFGFNFQSVTVMITASVRSDSDYGVDIGSLEINQALPFTAARTIIWGTPAAPRNDGLRKGCLDSTEVVPDPQPKDGGACRQPATEPQRALLTAPTSCTPAGVGLETRLFAESWVGSQQRLAFTSHQPAPDEQTQVGPTGCDALSFDPSIAVQPDAHEPDAPTGLAVRLSFPQDGIANPESLAAAHLKRVEVTLPDGMTINPAAADGLGACSDAELGLRSKAPPRCPESSRIGEVEATTPVLDEKLAGGVYIRSQGSDAPASGEMFRLAIVLENEERGLSVRLAGAVHVDPADGRITTVFDDNPQLPVDGVTLKLKGGRRAPLATPATCGEKSISARMTSWSGKTVELSDGFTIDCLGPDRFEPTFDAGSVSPTGGAFSPFVASIERSDGERFLSGVTVELPSGLIAKLRGVPLCDGYQAENGGCPSGSRVGTATAAAGAGSPYLVRGDVFLTDGYRGAPYGLAVHVRAQAGPFDLGWVRVRQALNVDPETAQVSVVSDPLPQVVAGVPVRLRSVHVDVDRPQFATNPTGCTEKRVDAKLTSVDGLVRSASTRFQASDCSALGYSPKLSMRLSGRGQTRTGRHPRLAATLTQGSSQANTASAKVTLPKSLALDARNSADPKLLCGYEASLTADCPASTVIGRATAVTPVLNQPLSGPVHLVQGIRFSKTGNRIRTTPSLLVKLRGEVAINLRARTDSKRGLLITTFPQVPDAPVSRFRMSIEGGKKGILVVTASRRGKIDICRGKQVASVETDGHNDKAADYGTVIATPCSRKFKPSRQAGRR